MPFFIHYQQQKKQNTFFSVHWLWFVFVLSSSGLSLRNVVKALSYLHIVKRKATSLYGSGGFKSINLRRYINQKKKDLRIYYRRDILIKVGSERRSGYGLP
ncbi:MAG TPA: hypothetical protein VLE21_04515 [Candidatus Nitrosocosmicus sp.]|nr:hypothetical protein [Candidatus Nitrosocosmicus sp.]